MNAIKNALRRLAGAPTIEAEMTDRQIQAAAVAALERENERVKQLQEKIALLEMELAAARTRPVGDSQPPQYCATCAYYRSRNDAALPRLIPRDSIYTGICTKQPPTALSKEASTFPLVHERDSCGHHFPAPAQPAPSQPDNDAETQEELCSESE